jgi:AcrR family transcriptional regulator
MNKKATEKTQLIFEATLRLTGQVGLSGLKMSNIAKEAGMASGTLYIYFKSKEELLNALYLQLERQGASGITQHIQHLPVPTQFYKMWRAALKELVTNSLRVIFMDQFVRSPYISEENQATDQAFKTYLYRLLDQGKEEGLIRNSDNAILVALIMGFIRQYAFHLVETQPKLLSEAQIDHSFAVCWDALKR